MMAERNKKALGRGLDSIFGQDVSQFLDEIQSNGREAPGRREIEVAVSEIRPNPYQPRKEFDEKALNELADSIKLHGIFTPLLVRKSVRGYELITGERRLRAARIAGLTTVPAISVDFTEEQMMEISILENVQREDLNPIEEASAYESLISRLGYTQEKLAQRVGKSREYCANMLRLLKLPAKIQHDLKVGLLSVGHAKVLLGVDDIKLQEYLCDLVIKEDLSVRQLEDKIRKLTEPKKDNTDQGQDLPDEYFKVLEIVGKYFENNISLKRSDSGKGSMTIHFNSDEEVKNFLKALEDSKF